MEGLPEDAALQLQEEQLRILQLRAPPGGLRLWRGEPGQPLLHSAQGQPVYPVGRVQLCIEQALDGGQHLWCERGMRSELALELNIV